MASSQVHCPTHMDSLDPAHIETRLSEASHCAMQRPVGGGDAEGGDVVGGAVTESALPPPALDSGTQLKSQDREGQKNAVQEAPEQMSHTCPSLPGFLVHVPV